eukprot:55619_1
MGFSLSCCGTFCCFVSIVCAIMQFVFYALLTENNMRIDIGDSKADRHDFSGTPFWTAIVYVAFVLLSLVCMAVGRKQSSYEIGGRHEIGSSDEEESAHLINKSDSINHYDATRPVVSSLVSRD